MLTLLCLLLGATTLSGQSVMPVPRQQFLDNNGDPCAGCLLYSFAAGTATEQNTYADVTLATPNENPIELDSAGRATVFLDTRLTYKFSLNTAADVPIWTVDSIDAVPSALNVEVSGVAGETLAQRQIVYLSSGLDATVAGRWYLTDADVVSKSSGASLVGVVISPAIGALASGTIRIQGRVTGYSGLSEGLSYFVSATAGELTSTAPANVKVVGVAESSSTLLLTPSAATSGGVGAFSSLQISGTAANAIDVAGGIEAGTGNVQIVDATGKIPALSSTTLADLSGANLTALNATNIGSGTLADARLSANVPLKAGTETISGQWTFTGAPPSLAATNQIRVTADASANALVVFGRAADSGSTILFRDALNSATYGAIQIDPPNSLMRLQAGVPAVTVLDLTPSGVSSFVPLTVTGTLGVTSNATVGGTLGVTGAATLSSTLDVTGSTSGTRINSHSAQPGFLAFNSATDPSVANGATVEFNTEVYDTAGNFAANTFTAPVAGIYLFTVTVEASFSGPSNVIITLVTSNRGYTVRELTAEGVLSFTVFADMDASDTAFVRLNHPGLAVNITGGVSPYATFFSGRLVP